MNKNDTIIFIGVCKPYSVEACEDAAEVIGKKFYVGDWSTKGCYSYASGEHVNDVYYSTGGLTSEMRRSLALPKYRPSGHDCKTYGTLYFGFLLSHTLNIIIIQIFYKDLFY